MDTPVDLSTLENFNFAPQWDAKRISARADAGRRERGIARPRKFDDRERAPRAERTRQSDGDAGHSLRREHAPREHTARRKVVLEAPTVQIAVYPEEAAFQNFLKHLRTSSKTRELFGFVRQFFDKPEYFAVTLKKIATTDVDGGHLFISVPDGVVFEREQEAIDHVFAHHADKFIVGETQSVEAPKGVFPMINVCGITDQPICPPNYHRYQELLQKHYDAHAKHVPYKVFLSRIRTVKDADMLAAWQERMQTETLYKSVLDAEGGEVFKTFEAAKRYLLEHHKAAVVKASENVRIPGLKLADLPDGSIRRQVVSYLVKQKSYPLDTANHIRGRLRKSGVHFYKQGKITHVSSVKRKAIAADAVFAPGVRQLIDVIVQKPKITIEELTQMPLTTAEGAQQTPQQILTDLQWLTAEGYVCQYEDGTLTVLVA